RASRRSRDRRVPVSADVAAGRPRDLGNDRFPPGGRAHARSAPGIRTESVAETRAVAKVHDSAPRGPKIARHRKAAGRMVLRAFPGPGGAPIAPGSGRCPPGRSGPRGAPCDPMTRRDYLPFGKPNFSDDEIAAVTRVMRSGWVGMGPETIAFESE